MSQWLRFSAVVVLLGATVGLLEARDRTEVIPPRRGLSSFPEQIGTWQGRPLPITVNELEVLGPGDFLMRDYQSPSAAASVNLYIAYFQSQRTGDTIHSPKNCLPGSGWSPLRSEQLEIRNADGSIMYVNRYIVAKGLSRALVLYWYQAHGRVTSNEYVAKLRLVEDAIRMNRTDGSLVRVVVPFDQNDPSAAQNIALAFVAQIQPLLEQYIPR